MKFNRRHFLGVVAAGSTGLVAPRAFAAVRSGEQPALLGRARAALDAHAASITHRDIIGLVDFGLPSAHPRLQLVDLANGRVVANYLVSHGRGSDPANIGLVERFSNTPGSNASSRGSYVAGDTYYGKHGRSRRLRGLDPENSMAFSRAIVIHAAPYVTPVAAISSGRIGRSEGCFAVSQGTIGEVLAHLGTGRLLFAWK